MSTAHVQKLKIQFDTRRLPNDEVGFKVPASGLPFGSGPEVQKIRTASCISNAGINN